MKQHFSAQSAFFLPRLLLAFTLCLMAVVLAVFSFAAGTPVLERPSAPDVREVRIDFTSGPLAPGAPGWSLINSPNITSQTVSSVTCVSPTFCFAVGNYFNPTTNRSQTLIQQWNGSSWSVVPSPNTATTRSNSLLGVTCTSATQCWAVGQFQNTSGIQQPLILKWDGASWALIASNSNTTLHNYLTQITCNSAVDCWAVGAITTGTISQTLIERWNGVAWSVVTSPNTSPTQSNSFADVTCSSATDCWAVGSYSTGSNSQTLIARWNGAAWSIVASPNSGATQDNLLAGVTCVSTTDCWATGAYLPGANYQTLALHWNGAAWSAVASPNGNPTLHNVLYDVQCVSSSNCTGIGYTIDGSGVGQTLTEHWDGVAWSLVPSPNATSDNFLYGLACTSASDCWAVGYLNLGFLSQVQMLRWNGTSWAIVAATNTGISNLTENNSLHGIACASPTDCWAVGERIGTASQTLIERWNGSSWSILSSPNTSVARDNILTDVTCVTASDCWATGAYETDLGIYQTLILHWNGTSWAAVPSPNSSANEINAFNAVSCNSASDCWAVGQFVNGNSALQTLVARWNGTNWSLVASPNSSATEANQLEDVTCVSPTECWAVGGFTTGGVSRALIQRWNGTAWSIFPAPNTSPTQNNFLSGVACTAPSACWGVGNYFNGTASQTLIQQWNGISAVIVASPNNSTTQNHSLKGIACASPTQCWAVGDFVSAGIRRSLIEKWNGASWTIDISNNSSTQDNGLDDATCTTGPNCWAVGTRIVTGVSQTLINQYAPTTPPLAHAASRLTHGTLGKYDVDLPQTGPRGVECRSGGGTDAYQMVFTFANNLTSVGSVNSSGTGTAAAAVLGPNQNQCTVNVTGVTSGSTLTVTLNGVVDSENNTGNVPATLNVLLGDTNGNGSVNASDVGQTKAQSGATISPANFRTDVNANGAITSSDISLVKSRSGTSLP